MDTCATQESSMNWNGAECAVLYRENKCQTCFFTPQQMSNNSFFFSLNAYQIKSLVVRPGCLVTRTTSGKLGVDYDYPYFEDFSGPVNHIKVLVQNKYCTNQRWDTYIKSLKFYFSLLITKTLRILRVLAGQLLKIGVYL